MPKGSKVTKIGVLSALREKHDKLTPKRKLKPLKERLAKYYLTEEEKAVHKREKKRKFNRTNEKKNREVWKKKQAEKGLTFINFTGVPKEVKEGIEADFKRLSLTKGEFLKLIYVTWQNMG